MKTTFLTLTIPLWLGSSSLVGAAETELAPYIFYTFDQRDAFPTGPLQESTHGIQVMTPHAWIDEGDAESSRHLQVSGAAVLLGQRFMQDGVTFLELWVRPRVAEMAEGAEFLDFDGAAIALFATEDGNVEIHALHIGEDERGFWISTGIRLPVSAGQTTDWHRVNITHQWKQKTWDLAVDGVAALQGLGRGICAEGRQFELWLYGHGPDKSNSFDDLLVTAIPPDALEKHQALQRRAAVRKKSLQAFAAKHVHRETKDANRRKHSQEKPEEAKAGKANILRLSVEIVGGGKHIASFESEGKSGEKEQFTLYSPSYDETGKPMPLQVKISCDAELREGATLGQIEWAITEDSKEETEGSQVILSGDFTSGPSLMATIPSEWSNKALSVRCGRLGLKKK